MFGNTRSSWASAAVIMFAALSAPRPATAGSLDDYGHIDPSGRYDDRIPFRSPTEAMRRPTSHIDDVATELEEAANDLCLELYYNYGHNPGFRQTYREAYEMLTLARYIHGLEHAGNRGKLRQAVAELSSLYRHVRADVAPWTGHHHRWIGFGGLTAKLESFEESLYHLMDDLGVRPGDRPVPPESAPIAAPDFDMAPQPAPQLAPRMDRP